MTALEISAEPDELGRLVRRSQRTALTYGGLAFVIAVALKVWLVRTVENYEYRGTLVAAVTLVPPRSAGPPR